MDTKYSQQKLEPSIEDAVIVNSDLHNHQDWCLDLIDEIDLQIFPQILSENIDHHEVIAFIFPRRKYNITEENRKKIKEIIYNRKETFRPVFLEPENRDMIFAHFRVKHEKARTFTGFLNNSKTYSPDCQIKKFLSQAENGCEKWVFDGRPDLLDNLKQEIADNNFGQIVKIDRKKSLMLKISMYEKFFNLLGTSKHESRILGMAKVYRLLNDPYNKDAITAVVKHSGISKNNLMNILDNGIMTSSWIYNSVKKLQQKSNQKILQNRNSVANLFNDYPIDL